MTRCGATGLRPTFGRVSRDGCMTLAWTMDKLGPIARSVEDCALVFGAIHGADGLDAAAVDRPFRWPRDPRPEGPSRRLLRAGQEGRRRAASTWKCLRELGVQAGADQLPDKYPADDLTTILTPRRRPRSTT